MTAVAGGIVAANDITSFQNLTLYRPLVRLVASGAQNLTLNTMTAITFTGSEDVDTHNYHNPASNASRVTPGIAGYYRCYGWFNFTSATSAIETFIGKNGTALPSGTREESLSAGFARGIFTTAMVQANGSGDYFELMALQNVSGGTTQPTNQSGRFSCVLEVEFLRPL